AQQVGIPGEPVHANSDNVRDLAMPDTGLLRELLFRAHGNIIPRYDAARGEEIQESGHNLMPGLIHALVQRLYDEVLAVSVNHKSRKQVAFCVNQPVHIGVRDDAPPIVARGSQTALEKSRVNCLDAAAEQPQGDLGSGAEVCGPEDTAGGIGNLNGGAWLGAAGINNIAGKNPEVPGGQATRRLAVDPDLPHSLSHGLQARDSLFCGWMSGKEPHQPLPREG